MITTLNSNTCSFQQLLFAVNFLSKSSQFSVVYVHCFYTLNSSTASGRKCAPSSPLPRTRSPETQRAPYTRTATVIDEDILASCPLVTLTNQSPANNHNIHRSTRWHSAEHNMHTSVTPRWNRRSIINGNLHRPKNTGKIRTKHYQCCYSLNSNAPKTFKPKFW